MKEIFKNETTNKISSSFLMESARLNVNISGVLDGADVLTWIIGANGIPTIVRTCSWMSSKADVLNNSDGGYEDLYKTIFYFEIKNVGALTNISLEFGADSYTEL